MFALFFTHLVNLNSVPPSAEPDSCCRPSLPLCPSGPVWWAAVLVAVTVEIAVVVAVVVVAVVAVAGAGMAVQLRTACDARSFPFKGSIPLRIPP